jgi:hypothetical protein
MPTKSEENKPVIQHIDDALGRVDTDALFASTHKGDPAERDRRVLRNMTFVASMGLAMVLAAMFTTILELPDFWRNLWLAICIGFAFFFLCGGVSLGFGTWASSKTRSFEVSHTAETESEFARAGWFWLLRPKILLTNSLPDGTPMSFL